MRNYKTLKAAVPVLVIIVLILVLVFFGLFKLESALLSTPNGLLSEEHSAQIIEADGVRYFPRQDVTVLMFLGIDEYGERFSSEHHRNYGSSDVVALLVFDEKSQECNVLYLNRDTMVDMNVVGVTGEFAGTVNGQLALAHTYGTGLEDSCENVRETVSRFLGGVYIDHYISLNMESISILNDAVGGVKVYVTEDFSTIDPTIPMGEVFLDGDQALNYVRTRKNVGDQLNLTRMERHKDYVQSFVQSFNACVETDDAFFADLMEQLLPYMVTDCSLNTLNSMYNRYESYNFSEIITLSGVNVIEGKYYAYHVDEKNLEDTVLRLFYAPLK